MAGLSETETWEADVYQIEVTDPVQGGAPNPVTGAGMSNIPHLHLANRTKWLKARVDSLLETVGGGGLQAASAILSAISGLSATGLISRTGVGTVAARTIAGGTGVTVTNGNGVAGNPTIGIDTTTAFGASIGASGWQRLPTGLIVQWGQATFTSAGNPVTFPIAFPNACRSVVTTPQDNNNQFAAAYAQTTTGFTGTLSGSGNTLTVNWIAIGN